MEVLILPTNTGHAFYYRVGKFMVYVNCKTPKDKHIEENRGGALKERNLFNLLC